jgi:hypothetical protein
MDTYYSDTGEIAPRYMFNMSSLVYLSIYFLGLSGWHMGRKISWSQILKLDRRACLHLCPKFHNEALKTEYQDADAEQKRGYSPWLCSNVASLIAQNAEHVLSVQNPPLLPRWKLPPRSLHEYKERIGTLP